MSYYEFENILSDETALNEFENILSFHFITGFRIEEVIITDYLIDLNNIREELQKFNNYQCIIQEQEVTEQDGKPLIGKFEIEDKDKNSIYSSFHIGELLEYMAKNIDDIEKIAQGGYFKKYSIKYIIELEPRVLYKWGGFGYFCLIDTNKRPYPYAKWLKYTPINTPFRVSSMNDWYFFNEDCELIGPNNKLDLSNKLSSNKE